MTDLTTFAVEFSYEATTLDYLSPLWYVRESFTGEDAALVQEVAEAAAVEVREEYDSRCGSNAGPCAFRARNATPVVYAETDYEAIDAAWSRQYWAGQARVAREAEQAVRDLREEFAKGNVVKVVKGRKVPVGTEGTVFWFGESKFGGFRVGFETFSGETHYTAVSNVEVIPGLVEVGA